MSDKKVFGREDILAAKNKRNVIRIDDVPGLGASIYILELKRSEFQEWIKQLGEEDAKLVASIICDETGKLLFDPNNPADLKEIEDSLTVRALQYIGMKAISENSANPQAVEKNLQASLNIAFSSALPPTSGAALTN